MNAPALRRARFALGFGAALAVWLVLIQPRFRFDPLDVVASAFTGPGAQFWIFFATMWAVCSLAAGGGALGAKGKDRGGDFSAWGT